MFRSTRPEAPGRALALATLAAALLLADPGTAAAQRDPVRQPRIDGGSDAGRSLDTGAEATRRSLDRSERDITDRALRAYDRRRDPPPIRHIDPRPHRDLDR